MGKHFACLAASCAAFVLAPAAASAATVIYSLSTSDPAAGLGSGPYGTVTVDEVAGGNLTFTVALASGFRFHETTPRNRESNHNLFAFSIAGNPNVTVSGLPAASGLSAFSEPNTSGVDAPPFGSFFTAIRCNAPTCPQGGGYPTAFQGPLSFTVSSAGGPLSLSSIGFNTINGENFYATADLINVNGLTGNVGATLAAVVPEPATWALFILGFGGIGGAMRSRRQRASYAF